MGGLKGLLCAIMTMAAVLFMSNVAALAGDTATAATPGSAPETPAETTPDPAAWQDVITGQIEAFRKGDGKAALGFAGTAFQKTFTDPNTFMISIAASGYGPIFTSVSHSFGKFTEDTIELVAGFGVAGDAHAGETVKHRSRVARDPSQPNLRQVHLLHAELFDELVGQGHAVFAGELGENVTTRGLDLLALPRGTRLALGPCAVVELTGLRNPCAQIERFQPGLLAAVLGRDADGGVVRKAGVMAVVLAGGPVRSGDTIAVSLPAGPREPLAVV